MSVALYRFGSVYKSYALSSNRGSEASTGGGVIQCETMKPLQVIVEIPGCDASVTSQETLQLAVPTVDCLNVKGVTHPLTS